MAAVFALLLATNALATRADADSHLLDSGAGQEQCYEDEATSLLQVKFAVKRSIGTDADNRTEASSRLAGPGKLGPLDPVQDPGTCSMVSAACWACMESYASGPMGTKDNEWAVKQWDSWMQAAGWTRDHELSIEGKDGMGFWTHAANQDCMLAFRGSDEPHEQVLQSFLAGGSTLGVGGIRTNPGTQKEFDEYFAAIKEKVGGSDVYAREGLKQYTDKCPGGIIAAGHSLGGGVAQLFAYLANKNGDPLGMKLPYAEGIKAVYGYGAVVVGYEPGFFEKKQLANDKRSDGCFPGGMYVNTKKTVKKEWGKTGTKQVYKQTGAAWKWKQHGFFGHWSLEPTYGYVSEDTWGWVNKEEILADMASRDFGRHDLWGYNYHLKTSVSLLYEKGQIGKTYGCGDMTEWWTQVKSAMVLMGTADDVHMPDKYTNKIGCM